MLNHSREKLLWFSQILLAMIALPLEIFCKILLIKIFAKCQYYLIVSYMIAMWNRATHTAATQQFQFCQISWIPSFFSLRLLHYSSYVHSQLVSDLAALDHLPFIKVLCKCDITDKARLLAVLTMNSQNETTKNMLVHIIRK